MAWIDREAMTPGVLSMLRVNMGLRDEERLLVVTDLPTPQQWAHLPPEDVEAMLRRAYFARLVAEVAREHLPAHPVRFLTYPSTGRSAVEPPDEVAEAMAAADVVLIITSFSLSHTDAREAACRAGARVASMPRFIPEMLYPDGPMAVDYQAVAAATRAMAGLITAAHRVRITTPAGTDVAFSVEGRDGRSDDGIYVTRGAWGNLPAGEAYCAPLEGTAQGRLVVEPGWHARLTEPMTIRLERGEVVALDGGGAVGAQITEILDLAGRSEATRPRRMLGELGIGTNPQARRTDITVEAEKIQGTVHLAVGDNSHMGGVVVADYHQDFVFPGPDVWFDDQPVIAGGRWVAPALAAT
ncbi:MAG: hypothetical protein QN187_04495 [Armatimonadota bacterium]|nr:hypothetical protein [Armatimonadota bacterium]MDR7518130.1 hypothetical protein [Armatimonadota bacterium]MDR7550275.1 hypothetical protein [Armatimonadota bacterium]